MLSSGMITHPFFIFPENFTHSIDRFFFANLCILDFKISLISPEMDAFSVLENAEIIQRMLLTYEGQNKNKLQINF